MDNFRFHYVNMSNQNEVQDKRKSLYDYQIAPLVFEQKPFDVYLADGMYRVNCACVSFLHAMKRGADMAEVRVAIHGGIGRNDDGGAGYDLMKTVADAEIRNKNLWVYKLKKDTTEHDLFTVWKVKYDAIKGGTAPEKKRIDKTISRSRDSKFDLIAKILYTR